MAGQPKDQEPMEVLVYEWREPTPRYYHSTAVVGDEVYLWAGEQRDMPEVHDSAEKQAFLSNVEVFTLNTGCWEQRATRGTPPLAVRGYSCVAVGNDLHYFGGECSHGGCYHNSVHTLSTSTLQWKTLAPTTSEEGAPMSKSGCGVVHFTDQEEGLLFAVGGCGSTPSYRQQGAQYEKDGRYARTNEQHIFSLSTCGWSSLTVTGQGPSPCSHFTLTKVGNKRAAMYGGWDGSRKLNHLFIVELGKHSVHWSNISTSIGHSVEWPPEKSDHAATHFFGPLFVIVGGRGSRSPHSTNNLWLCDTITKLWKKLPLLDESVAERYWHSVSTLQLGPHCMWLILFGGWYFKADTVIIEIIQGEDGEWFVWKVFKRDTFGSSTVYQEILKEGRKKGLSVAGNRIVKLELELQRLQKKAQQLQEDKTSTKQHQLKIDESLRQVQQQSEHVKQQLTHEQVASGKKSKEIEEGIRDLQQQEKIKDVPVSGSEGVEMEEHEAGSGGGEDPSSLQLTQDDVMHAYDVSLRASKEKEQQLRSQLATVEQESHDKEQQLSKLEDENYGLHKERLVLKHANEQQQEELKRLQQMIGEDEARVTASKEEQLQQHQRMGHARDVQISQLQNENKRAEDRFDALKASYLQLKAASSEKQSVDTVDTGVQADYLAVAPGFLRGVEVYGETVLEVVGDKPQKLKWPGYGFYMEVPDGALAPGVTASVGVKVILSGQFKLPDNRQLISAIYWISSSEVFLKEVAINIQHFAVITSEEQCSKFSFIIAKCSQKELPYTFREREGSFNPHSQYGAIKLKQFSLVGETSPEATELRFTSLKFYKPISGTLKVDFIFVVVCNHEVFLECIRKEYIGYSEDKQSLMLAFDEDAIVLDLPDSPPQVVNEWKLLPLTHPEIEKLDILNFKHGKNAPACSVELEWTGSGEPKPLFHQVKITGTKKPAYFHLRYYPKAATDTSTSALVTSTMAASSFSKIQCDATPTLLKLKTMKGADGKTLKIIATISAGDYMTFGMFLLQDENGDGVDLIKDDHIHGGAVGVTQAILKKWLTSGAAPTRTYQHLIKCLEQSELGALAEKIADVISY